MDKRAFSLRSVTAAAAVAAAAAIAACASAPPSDPAARTESLRADAARFSAEIAIDPRDVPAMTEGFAEFLAYLDRAYGPEIAEALHGIRRPDDLTGLLSSRYQTAPSRKIAEAFVYWDRARKKESWDDRKAERFETEHFSIAAMPGTAGYRDRDFIARACEEYLRSAAILGREEEFAARYHANMAALSEGKIVVMVPPNARFLGGSRKTATTSYGLSIGDEGELRIQVVVRVPYYNALSSTDLARQIIHARDFLQRIDLTSAPRSARAGESKAERKAAVAAFKSWADAAFDRVVPNDRPLGEGVAEYAAARIDPIGRSLFGRPDDDLRAGAGQARLPGDILPRSVTAKEPRARLLRYTELHSFIAFLIGTYGEDRFQEFYGRVPPDEANFIAAYGTDFAGMQVRWRESLR